MKALNTIYNMVCENPQGVGFHIDYMPDYFDYDEIDKHIPCVHTYYEILWFREAGGIHTVDFQNYDVKENMVFFLSPGQVHYFDYQTPQKGVSLKFCTDFLREDNGNENLFIKYSMFHAYENVPYCVLDKNIIPILNSLVRLMEDEQKYEGAFAHLDMLRSIVKIFLIKINRNSTRSDNCPNIESKASHRLFLKFRRELEMNYCAKHTVKDYAKMLNVSIKTLSNSVKECSNKTALTFINDRLMLEAKRMIRFSRMRINEIAFCLGFEDPSYFVKIFKRLTGFLPTDFRDMENSLKYNPISDCWNPIQKQ